MISLVPRQLNQHACTSGHIGINVSIAGLPAWLQPPCALVETARQMQAVRELLLDGVPHPARGLAGLQAGDQDEQLAAVRWWWRFVAQACALAAVEGSCLMLAECAGQLPAVQNITRHAFQVEWGLQVFDCDDRMCKH